MTHLTPPAPSPAVDAGQPESQRRSARGTATALLVVATVLAGTLSPLQSTVNGALGKEIGDGNAAAVISFGSGLILMFLIVFARRTTRRQALALPRLIRGGEVGWWNYLAGLCGGAVVLSEGIAVGALGVAVFQIALICGMVISGVVCDRFGVTSEVKQPVSPPRLLGAVLAVAATTLAISPALHVPGAVALAVLPFAAGLLAGWQPAGNAAVARSSGSMLVSIGFNFLVGFTVLLVGYLVRLATGSGHFALPDAWWMYTGGALGLLSIAFMALLVRGLGLLLLGLSSVAGQLLGSLILGAVSPSLGEDVHLATIGGTVLALVAAGIAMIPARSTKVAGQS
ncbi:DMT family transporter [Streptomyces iconiensis]|uniref:DMT family transporter n=1 Tax=Streptomyces iconiensis TaxID=1384038 RepID=A0ABT6ZYT6_9ACTN|nr:DMT family transporter [Streptomyces iconiensis]MDJ1133573.1 DMT family transporter [Streptomyces iconiensis]